MARRNNAQPVKSLKRRQIAWRKQGVALAEWVAGAVLFIPAFVSIVFVVCEVSYGYAIKINLDDAARRTAKQLAVDYGIDPVNNATNAHAQAVFSNVRIPGFVADNTQLKEVVWSTGSQPYTVTVFLDYPPGGIPGKLPPWPNPDPLKLGNSFHLSTLATFALY